MPIILGIILYLIIYKLTKNIAGVNNWDNRSEFIQLSQIGERFNEIFTFLPFLLYKEWWIIPKILNVLLLSTIVFLTLLNYKKFYYIFTFFAAIAIFLFPISILKSWEPSHRALSGFAFIYGCYLSLFIIKNKIVYCISIVCVFISVLCSNSFLSKVETENKFSERIAWDISKDIQSNNFNNNPIRIVNNNRIPMADWAFWGLFYYSTGNIYNFVSPSQEDIDKCSINPKFPVAGYMFLHNDYVLVCL